MPVKATCRPTAAQIARARDLYEGFTGKAPRTLKRLSIPRLPATGLAIGKVLGVIYEVTATKEKLIHEFKGKARPSLVVSSDGRQVYWHGGAYTFTKRGFVDRRS